MSRYIRLCLVSALIGVAYSGDGDYSYTDLDGWEEFAPVCKYGVLQSPINLGAGARKVTIKKPNIEFVNYHIKPILINILNDGHTANLTGNWPTGRPYVTGDLVNGEKYNFLDLHSHWGSSRDNGTEHTINGRQFATELHLVHINSKYKDMAEALDYVDGILVVGLLFEVTRERPPLYGIQMLSALDSSVSKLNSLRSLKSQDFYLSLLKLDTIKEFYTYRGSLTTPPCTENVRWIVSSKVFAMDEDSVKALRKINLGHKELSNVRPVQPLNNREVELYILK